MKIWKLSGSLNLIQTLPQAATDFKKIATFCCWVERCLLKAGNVKVLSRRKFTSGVVDFLCISCLISRKRNQMWNWFEMQVFNFFCWNVVSIPIFLGYFFFISMCLIISHLFLLDKVSSSQYEIFLLVFCCCCLYITFTNVCHLLTRVAHVNRRYCPIMFDFSLFVCHLWVYRGRASWEKQQSTCFLAKTWCSAEKWRNLLLRNLLTSGRSASRPALFVAIMEYVQVLKDTSIIVLSCAVIVSDVSRDALKGTSWNSKFVFEENRWRTL